jgi:AcrR family transcriptional regulator
MDGPSARLVDTVVDLIARDGLDAVSIRRVATAAGVSIGAVQHHFPTKDALLAAAMDRIETAFVEHLAGQLGDGTRPGQALRAVAHELVPVDGEARAGTVVWTWFVARAMVDEPTADRHRRSWRALEDVLARLLAAHHGTDPADQAPADAAAGLLALLDGLSLAAATEPGRMPPDRAARLIDEHVDRLLEPSAPSTAVSR